MKTIPAYDSSTRSQVELEKYRGYAKRFAKEIIRVANCYEAMYRDCPFCRHEGYGSHEDCCVYLVAKRLMKKESQK